MSPEEMVFTVILTAIFGSLFLVFIKMILNFFREKRQSNGASLGAGELEAMIQRAVETGQTIRPGDMVMALADMDTMRVRVFLGEQDYINLDKESGKYRGALKLSALGSEVLARFDLKVHMRPHLVELHRTTEHTCNLGIRNGDTGVYIDRIESQLYRSRDLIDVVSARTLRANGRKDQLVVGDRDVVR